MAYLALLRRFAPALLMVMLLLDGSTPSQAKPLLLPGIGPTLSNPILFVTQPPWRYDFTSANAVFGNHKASLSDVPRGGDLWIRYGDGTLKNLTEAAGYGSSGMQGANAIAVRDPAVYWDGTKAIFSMVIGAPTKQYQVNTYYWQLYEITGLGKDDTPVITKVSNQPANFNNVSPIYGTDDRIIFTTDRPRNGAAQLYPQRDEYELAPTVSGLWSLDPATGDLRLLNHAPSGDFTPIVDSFGRVLFTQWDHMQRDQQADADDPDTPGKANNECNDGGNKYGTFNYSDESASAVYTLGVRSEVYPEPRACRKDLLEGTHLAGQTINQFFPWTILEDGSEGEILNHVGRHELGGYFDVTFTDDPNFVYCCGVSPRPNQFAIESMLQIKEDPLRPGLYYGTNAPEFGSHAGGTLISIDAPPTRNAETMTVTVVTEDNVGTYREPVPMSDGTLIAVHTDDNDTESGSGGPHGSSYEYRLKQLSKAGNGYFVANQPLTAGISKTIEYWDPDTKVTFSGVMWELNPVEVRARTRPTRLTKTLAGPEQAVFNSAGVDVNELKAYMEQNGLALIVSRDVTTRDRADHQQPFNLKVSGTNHQTIGASGKIYDVAYIQLFQGDQLRGWTGCCSDTPASGRRVIAQYLHDDNALSNNLSEVGAPQSSYKIANDGSVAAFVPAQRAMTWQLVDDAGTGIVRERYWVTFQPGEIRMCTSCHGINTVDQAGNSAPTNQPQALLALLQDWKAKHCTAGSCGVATATPQPATATPTATTTPPAADTPSPTVPPTATATPTPTTAPPTLENCDVFPSDNIWNATVDTLPLDANSTAYINTIGMNQGFHADFGSGLWEGGPIGIPYMVVASSQPKVAMSFRWPDESDPGPYPIPTDAPIEGGPQSNGDRHVLVLDKDNCILYETYRSFQQQDGSWHADSAAIFDLKSNQLRHDTWTSADAAGLPILPGLVRYDEVASGEIRHAIRFTVPETRNTYVWPARHQASDLTESQYPPMGQRFRLKANYPLASFSPQMRVILQAMKTYGIILADNGSSWYISGAPDERWDNDMLHEIDVLKGSDFEAVDVSSLMVNVDSGQVKASEIEQGQAVYLPLLSR
ncbi:MAG: hypothetical protein U0175_20380 [Caldilineaceae bacterium]